MCRAVPIVVVAFNRPKSLDRLLKSLDQAIYDRNDVPLIISIDKGDNQEVLNVANKYRWKYGKKIVIYQKENLKLRRHILKCGDYALEYGSIIILEDDLYVSPYFYDYAVKALSFSDRSDRIGGVSLYNHRYNMIASEPFEPMDDKFDNWYFQFASSWGEAWTKKQWQAFITWYNMNPEIEKMANLPQYVKNWPSSSWLKYFIAYLIDKDKYFIYPKKSLSTNFGDAGTHVNSSNTNFQVPLQQAKIDYSFSDLKQSSCIYDAYFENVELRNIVAGKVTAVDLYGQKICMKSMGVDYILTRKELPYKIIKCFGCFMRPHDSNIFQDISGNDFYLYDINESASPSIKKSAIRKVQYNLRYIDHSQYLAITLMFIGKTLNGIKRRLKMNR